MKLGGNGWVKGVRINGNEVIVSDSTWKRVETQFSNAHCKLSSVEATIGTGGETPPSLSEK